MTTIDGKSPNLAHETTATIHDLLMEPAIRERLAQICPDAFCDGDLQMDLLLEAMGKYHTTEDIKELVVDENERYEFRWSGKQKAKYESQKSSTGTLRPCPEESKNWDTTQNLYIEGDNLEVLKILKRAYAGKIKMIYIDPPYNTGKDFVYKDDYTDNLKNYLEQTGQLTAEGKPKSSNTTADGRFHTNWLNMMYPRLRLARELLSDDGVILINIDENEVDNLRKIMLELFHPENDLNTIVWDKRNPKGDKFGVAQQHEYIVVFAKNVDVLSKQGEIKRKKKNAQKMIDKARKIYNKYKDIKTQDEINEEFKLWLNKQSGISAGEAAYSLIDDSGELYQEVSMAWPNKNPAPDEYYIPLIHPITKKECPVPKRGWRNPPQTMQELLSRGEIIFGEDETTQPRRKYLLKNNLTENVASMLYCGGSDTELLEKLGIIFDTPKVVDVCLEHIDTFTGKDDIIIDFFSGSSTTAHAVMKLNSMMNTHRKFIMVQFEEMIKLKIADSGKNKGKPVKCLENDMIAFLDSIYPKNIIKDEIGDIIKRLRSYNLCDIGKERIRRAGDKIIEDAKKAGKDVSGLDVGFKVFKLSESNMNKWHLELADLKDKSAMEKAAIAELQAGKNTIRRKEIEAENTKRKAAGLAPFDTDLCVIYEWLLKYGVTPDCRITTAQIGGHKVYSVSGGAFMICLEHGLNRDWAQALVAYRDECLSGMDDATKSDAWHVMVADECFDDTRDMQNVAKTLHDNGLKDEHWIVV